MSDNDPEKQAKAALIGEVVRAAVENPEVKKAGQQLGRAALTVSKAINNALIPLAAVNFAFDKAKTYFADRFEADLSPKLSRIPPEDICEPKASVAGPALQALAFSHDEPQLREMYLNLLTSAMNGRVARDAHPAFVEILKQIDSEEAVFLNEVLAPLEKIPLAEVRVHVTSGGYHVAHRHLMNNRDDVTGSPIVEPRLPAMVDNWVRLGLVDVDYITHLHSPTAYEWVDKRPEIVSLREALKENARIVQWQKGMMVATSLGQQFARVVGIPNIAKR